MGRGNTSNPHDTDPNRVRKQTALPVQKARVVDASGMPDENGFHTARIKVYSDDAPYDAPVITPMHGSVWVPEPGTDVAVIFAEAEKPWIIGAWYAVDRVDSGEVDLPNYEPGDIIVGNQSGYVGVRKDGSIETSEPLEHRYVGSFTVTGTGDITVSGLPFSPSMVEFEGEAVGGQNVDRAGTGSSTVENYAGSFSGTARDDGHRQVVHSGGSGNSINQTSHYSSDSQCIAIRYAGQNGSKLGMLEGDVTSWNEDGFTVNVSSYQQNEVITYTAYR